MSNPLGKFSIIDLLLKEKLLTQKIMSYWTSPAGNRGGVIMGGFDTGKFAEESLHYFPVVRNIAKADHSDVLWTIELLEIRVGEETVKLPFSSAVFTLDTDSSRFKGDPLIIGQIRDLISEDGAKPCNIKFSIQLNSYPDLILVLRDQSNMHYSQIHLLTYRVL